MAAVEGIEDRWDRDWLVETDKAWDAIHRCLTGGTLEYGPTPLHKCILGEASRHEGDGYIVNLLGTRRGQGGGGGDRVHRRGLDAWGLPAIDPGDYDAETSEGDSGTPGTTSGNSVSSSRRRPSTTGRWSSPWTGWVAPERTPGRPSGKGNALPPIEPGPHLCRNSHRFSRTMLPILLLCSRQVAGVNGRCHGVRPRSLRVAKWAEIDPLIDREMTMADLTNVFTDIPDGLPEERIQSLLSTPGLRIERIVSLGRRSPAGFWYDQQGHEWVLLPLGRSGEAGAEDFFQRDLGTWGHHRRPSGPGWRPSGPRTPAPGGRTPILGVVRRPRAGYVDDFHGAVLASDGPGQDDVDEPPVPGRVARSGEIAKAQTCLAIFALVASFFGSYPGEDFSPRLVVSSGVATSSRWAESHPSIGLMDYLLASRRSLKPLPSGQPSPVERPSDAPSPKADALCLSAQPSQSPTVPLRGGPPGRPPCPPPRPETNPRVAVPPSWHPSPIA